MNGVTLTLEGAVWNGGILQLSFAIQGAGIPEDIPSGTSLNRDFSSITLAERQRAAYIRKNREEVEKALVEAGGLAGPSTQAERDAEVQSRMNRGEPRLVHRFQLIRSGGKDTLMMTVPIGAYVEQPELTVHLENLAVYRKGDLYGANPSDGYKPVFTLPGPYDFTFTVKKHLEPLIYEGAVNVTVHGVPIQVQRVAISAFGAKLGYAAMREDQDAKSMEVIRLTGVWTKDDKFVKGSSTGAGRASDAIKGATNASGFVSNSHPVIMDPASVTAVNLDEIRVDLSKLTLLEKEPAILILGSSPEANREKSECTEDGKLTESEEERAA